MNRLTQFAALLAAASLAACSSSTNGTGGSNGATGNSGATSTSGSGGTSGTGSTSGASSGSGSGSGQYIACDGGLPYCNSLEFQDSSSNIAFLGTYPEADNLVFYCDDSWKAFQDAGVGATVTALSGILDVDTAMELAKGADSTVLAIFPESCADIGIPDADGGLPPTDGGALPSAPSGAQSVNQVINAGSVSGVTLYGVVTYIKSPYWDVKDTPPKGAAGTIYIQDPAPTDGGAPVPLSGIALYISKDYVSDAGAYGYPDSGLALGDVVSITNVSSDPYEGQRELAYSASSVITVLGQTTLPPAMPLSAADLVTSNSQGSGYAGMRVTTQGGPDTLTNKCPLATQSCP